MLAACLRSLSETLGRSGQGLFQRIYGAGFCAAMLWYGLLTIGIYFI
jgi:hypothetical protein